MVRGSGLDTKHLCCPKGKNVMTVAGGTRKARKRKPFCSCKAPRRQRDVGARPGVHPISLGEKQSSLFVSGPRAEGAEAQSKSLWTAQEWRAHPREAAVLTKAPAIATQPSRMQLGGVRAERSWQAVQSGASPSQLSWPDQTPQLTGKTSCCRPPSSGRKQSSGPETVSMTRTGTSVRGQLQSPVKET